MKYITKQINVDELKPGDYFLRNKQRIPREVKKVLSIDDFKCNTPPEHKGKLMVILDNCRQLILHPKGTVKLVTNHSDIAV